MRTDLMQAASRLAGEKGVFGIAAVNCDSFGGRIIIRIVIIIIIIIIYKILLHFNPLSVTFFWYGVVKKM